MAPFLAEAADSGADVYAATANRQIAPHLQSYLLGFTRGVLADRPLARFFRSIGPAPSKMDYVRRYEVGLSTLLRNEGYGTYVKWLSPGWEREADNRSLKDWRQLLDEGFPFIKKMLLTGEDADNIAREIDARFGILVKEWL
jgi:lipopolysaccharide biosynthesis protein